MGGTYTEFTLESALVVQPGDVTRIEGDKLRVYRDELLIDERDLIGGNVLTEPPWDVERVFERVYVFVEGPKMPGTIATQTDVIVNQSTGTIRFKFADGSEREFESFAAAVTAVEKYDTSPEVVQDLTILRSLRNSPDGANLETMIGILCASDFTASQPVVFGDQ